jgi:hypothetical protein
LFIGTINNRVSNSFKNNYAWTSELTIYNKIISFQIGTGAVANIMSINNFTELSLPFVLIESSKAMLKSYTGDVLPIIRTCKLICKYNEVNHEIIFYVVNDVTESLLGLKTCVELRIITRNEPKNFKETNLLPVHQVERSENNDYQNIIQTFRGVLGY